MNIPIIIPAIPRWIWIIILVVTVAAFLKSPIGKGMVGELMVSWWAIIYLNKKNYHLIWNVTLPTESGTTQIDHIIVSRYGVFVIETKNFKGWIFGKERGKNWTQKIYQRSVSFQNPLRQNYKHTKTLESLLNINHNKIFSVIAFVGDSVFKTEMPNNVTYAKGSIKFIQSKTDVVFSDLEVKEIVRKISKTRLKGIFKTHRKHVEHLKSLHSTEAEQDSISPGIKVDPWEEKRRMKLDDKKFPGYKTGLTEILVKDIHGGSRQDSKFWQSEFKDPKDKKSDNDFQTSSIIHKSLKYGGVMLLVCCFAFIVLTSISMVIDPKRSVISQLSNIYVEKENKEPVNISLNAAYVNSNLNNKPLKNAEYTFSGPEIENAKRELLAGKNKSTFSSKKGNDQTQETLKRQFDNEEKNHQKYYYEITLLSHKLMNNTNK